MASSKQKDARSAAKRILSELKDYQSEPNECLLHLAPASDDELTEWNAVMTGVDGTGYEGGCWLLHVSLPSNYPLSPPKVRFSTPICHPNINFRTGEICLDTLKSAWSPAYTISSTLTTVHQLLTSAEPDSPLNIDVAVLLREGDELGARSLVRYYTSMFRYDGPLIPRR